MKKLLIVTLLIQYTVFGQVPEFDKACSVIVSLHGSHYKKDKYIFLKNKPTGDDYYIRNYLITRMPQDTICDYLKYPTKFLSLEKEIIKPKIDIDLRKSKYFNKKNKEFKKGILITFVQFDGRFLRVNADIGNYSSTNYVSNFSHYEYQFVFDIYGRITFVDWILKQE
ncbi:MAG: hypothetical protein CFE22_07190 [Cytophagaceae bacterium BCCC1]|nr:MAG: hypothetical protein CFE22_07190 [Cytophagaceae bacterium BCCC1]